MADASIARYDATTGWLPAVCPKHGRPADRRIKRKFWGSSPWWLWALVVVCILLAARGGFLLLLVLAVALAVQKGDDYMMPGCHECDGARRSRAQLRWASGLAALAVLVAAAVLASVGLLLLAMPVLLGWILALSSFGDSIGAVTGKLDGPWLKLKGVHPAFIAALRPNPAWQPPPVQYGPPTPAAPWGQPYSG